jgi:hypothetical protein
MRTSMIIAALALALGACSDDSKQPIYDNSTIKDIGTKPDSPTTKKDTGTTQDTGPKKEASTPTEASTKDGAGPWSCKQISDCQKTCGIDMPCLDACKAKGCQSAKDAIQKVWDCAIKSCMLQCVGGFNTACEQCISGACPADFNACIVTNKC